MAPGTFFAACDCFWGWQGDDCSAPLTAEPRGAIVYMVYGDEKFVFFAAPARVCIVIPRVVLQVRGVLMERAAGAERELRQHLARVRQVVLLGMWRRA